MAEILTGSIEVVEADHEPAPERPGMVTTCAVSGCERTVVRLDDQVWRHVVVRR